VGVELYVFVAASVMTQNPPDPRVPLIDEAASTTPMRIGVGPTVLQSALQTEEMFSCRIVILRADWGNRVGGRHGLCDGAPWVVKCILTMIKRVEEV
jgi:hypothetical protein